MGCFSGHPHGSPRKPKKQGSTRLGTPPSINSSSKTHLASSTPSFRLALHSASSRLLFRHQGRVLLTSSPYYSPSSLKHHLSRADGGETPIIPHSAPIDGIATAAPSDISMVNPLFPLPVPPQSAATAGCNDDNQSAASSSSGSGSGSGLSVLSLTSSASNSVSNLPMMSPIVASPAGFKTYINPLGAPMTEEADHAKTWPHEDPPPLPLPLPPPPPGCSGVVLREFSFEELSGACQNFAQDFFIREGGAGPVYRAIVKDIAMSMGDLETLDVAVTRLIPAPIKQSFRKWKAEVHSLGRLSHPNLCKVVGFSADEPQHWSRHGLEQRERLLVYEHTLNGNLESCLYGRVDRAPLDWTTRLKIAVGAAQGLAYLHERAPRQVIFGSFKPINIQVDQAFNAKLSDFGFNAASKFTSTKCSKESLSASGAHEAVMELEIEGGDPYAAPEMKFSYCTDNEGTSVAASSNVWSFGIILLELLTGRQHMDSLFPAHERDLLQWVSAIVKNPRKLFLAMDPELKGRYSTKSAKMVADLALHCLSQDPLTRPTMREVAVVLTTFLSSSSSSSSTPLTPPPQSSSSTPLPLHVDRSAPLNLSFKSPINHSKSMKAYSPAMSPCKQKPSSPGNNTTHSSNLLQRPRSYHLVSVLATPARSICTTPATQSSLNGSDGYQVRDPGGGSFMGFFPGHVLSTNRVSRQIPSGKVSTNTCKKAAGLESMEADHSFLSRGDAGG